MYNETVKKVQHQRMVALEILRIENPVKCSIVQRLNRFVVEVKVGKYRHRASINNTVRLEQFLISGQKAHCIPQLKWMKTDFRLFAVQDWRQAAVIDTRLQMKAFENALAMQSIP